MDQDFGQPSSPAGPDLPVDAFAEVDDAGPDGEAPALVTQAMFRVVEWEGLLVIGQGGVTDEATGGMRVQANHEEEREVMGVPEGLETLVADLVVRGRVHEDHDGEQEVAGDAARLRVVDVEGALRPNLWGRLAISAYSVAALW